MIQLPIIGSFLEATGTILEKKVLRDKRMNYKNYTVYEFAAIILIMLTFIWFVWGLKPEALTPTNILIFAFVVIIATLANLFIFYSLKRENVTEFEPIWVMQPLFTILLAFILFSGERNWIIFALALIASLSLVISHIEKHHLKFDKYIIAALVGSFLFAVELVASKPLLPHYSPFSFYFLRCVFIFIITFLIYRPNFKKIGKTNIIMILAIGLIWALYRAIIYYGYESVGIIFTTIIFILSPVLMFIFAVVFLKEKPTMRQIISTIIIVICVALAITIKN
jgi:drug/metabolite transporter (DMT)-like permease